MGKLIAIEGLDGSGKTTQTKILMDRLRKTIGKEALHVKFPDYDSPSSSLVKMYLAGDFGNQPGDVNAYAASSFYAVDRYASYKKNWEPSYKKGLPIIVDRYVTANIIYQLSKLPKEQWDEYISWLEDLEYEKLGIPRPDRVLYLEVPVEISQELLLKRYEGESGKRDIHESNIAFLNACYESASYASKKLGWYKISCAENGKMRPIDVISEEIFNIVEPLL